MPISKSLSKGMIETLMDCHEREMLGQPPCLTDLKSLTGLITRSFIEHRTIQRNGKEVVGFFVTQTGKDFLEEYTKS